MVNKNRLLMAGFAVSLAVMTSVPTFAAPVSTTSQNPIVSLKDSRAEIGTITAEDKALLKDMFDAEYYAKMYPEIAATVGTDADKLFDYFINNGLKDGQQINKDFNVNAYRSAYADLNKRFGSSILEYYRHYVKEGKAEGRAITTVEKARDEGIIVTDFGGNKLAVDSSGKLVAGETAEKIILTDVKYKDAVDNIAAAELGVDPKQAFQMEKAVFIENITNVEGDAVAKQVEQGILPVVNTPVQTTPETPASPTVETPVVTPTPSNPTPSKPTPSKPVKKFDEAAYQRAVEEWEAKKPDKAFFSADYQARYLTWETQKPNRNDYIVSGKYAAKEDALKAYGERFDAWLLEMPEITDYMTGIQKAAYEQALSDWEEGMPSREDFIVTAFATKVEAESAYASDLKDWNDAAPKREDFVVGNYRTEDDALDAFDADLELWEEAEPKITDAKYLVGYKTDDDAQAAYEEDLELWEEAEPKITDDKYSVGYADEEAAQSAYNDAVKEHSDSEPQASDYVFYNNTYESQEAADAEYDRLSDLYSEWSAWNATELADYEGSVTTIFTVDDRTFTDTDEALAYAKELAKPDDSVTVEPVAEDYVYDETDESCPYASQDEADEAFERDKDLYDAWVAWDETEPSDYEDAIATSYKADDDVTGASFDSKDDALAKAKECAEPDNSVTIAPNAEDFVYYENEFESEEAANSAYTEEHDAWLAITIDREDFVVGNYETFEEAQAVFEDDHDKYIEEYGERPDRADYTLGNYETLEEAQAALKEDHDAYVAENGDKPEITDDKYSVGYVDDEAAQAAYEAEVTSYNEATPAPNMDDYTYGGYADDEAAQAAFETAVEEYSETTPDPINYVSTEAKNDYNNEMSGWESQAPDVDDYTYNNSQYESQAQADTAYDNAVKSWESSTPSFSGELTSSEQQNYDSAEKSWEDSKPNHDDFEIK